MASPNTGRKRISPEELEKRKQEIAAMKAVSEEKRQKRLYEKSAFFRNTSGKILWGFSLLVSIFCIVFIVDGWLGKKYTKYEIKSSSEDIVHLIKGGYLVASTFN